MKKKLSEEEREKKKQLEEFEIQIRKRVEEETRERLEKELRDRIEKETRENILKEIADRESRLKAEDERNEKEKKQLKDLVSDIEKILSLQTGAGGLIINDDGLVVDTKYKLTPEEAAENAYISKDPYLLSFNNCIQQFWNQSFIVAFVIGSNHVSLQQDSQLVTTLHVLSQISSNLPFGSIIFSSAASAVSGINDAHKKVEFKNLAALVPTSDAVEISILSCAIARKFTLSYHDEIKNSTYNKKSNKTYTSLKGMLLKAIDKVDSKLANSFTCKEGLDWLAADMSRICISYIFNCNKHELRRLVTEVATNRDTFTESLIDMVKDTYPISKPMIVTIDQQSSGGNTTTSGGASGHGDSNIKYADSDEVHKLQEANRKHEEEIKRLRKVTEGTKSIVDAFIDTTGIGANGQVQAAMRTADGKVKVIIDNPIADQNLAAIAQETENKLSDHSEKIDRLVEENERLRQQMSRNNNRGCCVIS